ncbi:MAG: FecR domain-containing protein [Polyangiaceae bacterium]
MKPSRERFDSANYELAAEAIGVALREAAAAATTPERLAVEAERLRRAVAQSRPTRRIRPRLVYSLAAAALGASLSFGAYWLSKSGGAPLALEAEVCNAPQAGTASRVFRPAGRHYVAACERKATELRFADGSRVGVEAEARLRVQDLYANGASLLLEKGRANVQVVHRSKQSRWTVAAGPFAVTVTGTRFDIAWEPASERLSVELFEGQVENRWAELFVRCDAQGWATFRGFDEGSTVEHHTSRGTRSEAGGCTGAHEARVSSFVRFASRIHSTRFTSAKAELDPNTGGARHPSHAVRFSSVPR